MLASIFLCLFPYFFFKEQKFKYRNLFLKGNLIPTFHQAGIFQKNKRGNFPATKMVHKVFCQACQKIIKPRKSSEHDCIRRRRSLVGGYNKKLNHPALISPGSVSFYLIGRLYLDPKLGKCFENKITLALSAEKMAY